MKHVSFGGKHWEVELDAIELKCHRKRIKKHRYSDHVKCSRVVISFYKLFFMFIELRSKDRCRKRVHDKCKLIIGLIYLTHSVSPACVSISLLCANVVTSSVRV